MFGGEIIHREGNVAIAVAERVRLGAPVIDGQLDLEIGLGVAQIDQGEAVEPKAVGNVEAEGATIEIDRARLVEHTDHRMNGLRHLFLRH